MKHLCWQAIVILLAAAPSFAQPTLDLSGEWELDSESRTDSVYLSPLGRRGMIVHTSQVITLQPIDIKPSASNLHGRPRTLALDGSEVRETGESATGEPFVWLSTIRRVSSALMITTSHPRGTEPGWQSLTILSLLGSGELEILSVGPNLWPSGTTHSLRFVYRKR